MCCALAPVARGADGAGPGHLGRRKHTTSSRKSFITSYRTPLPPRASSSGRSQRDPGSCFTSPEHSIRQGTSSGFRPAVRLDGMNGERPRPAETKEDGSETTHQGRVESGEGLISPPCRRRREDGQDGEMARWGPDAWGLCGSLSLNSWHASSPPDQTKMGPGCMRKKLEIPSGAVIRRVSDVM